jgi:hypothetical protein
MIMSPLYNSLVKKQGLSDVFDLGNGAFQVKGFREHNLKDLRWSAAKGEIDGGDMLASLPFARLCCGWCY